MPDFQGLLSSAFDLEWFSLTGDQQAAVLTQFVSAFNDPTDNGFATNLSVTQLTTDFHDLVGTGNLATYAASLIPQDLTTSD